MVTKDTNEVGEFLTFNGFRAYKFCSNKIVTEEGEVFKLYKGAHPRQIFTSPSSNGYIKVQYTDLNGTQVNTSMHQLVAKAFIDNPSKLEVVDHINENKLDNRVSNLRWTTLKGSNDYYNFKDDRKVQELMKQNCLLNTQLSEAKKLNKLIEAEKKELVRLQEEVAIQTSHILEKAKKQIELLKERELTTEASKAKVSKTIGLKFGSVEAMVKATSKPVIINGTEFTGVREAARFLTKQEDVTASIDTIRKEIRSLVNGKRSPWYYLGKYYINVKVQANG